MAELGAGTVQLLKFLDAIDEEATASKRDLERIWEENIRQVRGDQWRIRRAPYFFANVIKNQSKRKVAALTESKFQFHVRSIHAERDLASAVLFNAARSIFDRSATEEAIHRVGRFGFAMGSGFLNPVYDPEINEVVVEFLDPRQVAFDAYVTSSEELHRAQWQRIIRVMPLWEIRRRFPGYGALVKPDERVGAYLTGAAQRPRSRAVASILSGFPRSYRPGVVSRPGPIPRAEVREYWIRDPQIGGTGELLYPGGRRVLRAGSVVLVDEKNPYWDGLFPPEMLVWDPDLDSPWGLDEVQDLRRIQEAINRLGDAWVRNAILGSNFKVIADMDALDQDQWKELDNEAGLIIKKRPQREFRYEPSTEASQTIPSVVTGFIKLCDYLTGMGEEGGRSRSPAEQSASFEGLQMARQSLVRDISRRLEAMLERVGQKVISRVFQFYTGDRVLLQQGPSREWIAYTFERQKLLVDDQGRTLSATAREHLWKDFRFLVTPGSSLATTRVARTMAALQLRSATGVAPSVRRILLEADLGDPDELIREGLEEMQRLPPPPPPKGRAGRR